MLNQCVLVGRVKELPQLKTTGNGTKVATLLLEVDKSFRTAEGIVEKEVYNIQLWRGIAETCCDVCTPGSLVGIKGRLQANNNNAKNGVTYYNCEVVAERVAFLTGNQPDVTGHAE